MKFNSRVFWKLMGVFAILDLCLVLAGCSTAWTSEAVQIITLLGPIVQSAIAILAAFGVGLPPGTLAAFQKWSGDAQSALIELKGLIDEYNTAEASAQPGLLNEIQTLLSTVSGSLSDILPTLHITNAQTQEKITAIVQLIAQELTALMALIPAVQGKVTSSHDLMKLVKESGYQHPKDLKNAFNEKARFFGPQYEVE
jgi:hypothetical protein